MILLVACQSPAWGNENWFETGVRHLKARSFEPAIQAFSRSLETIDDDYEAYNNRGVAYSLLDRLDEALADFNRALRLKPDYGAAILNRGISYRRKGQVAAAIQDYGTLIATQPEYIKAHQNLSWILATCPDPRFRNGSQALALIRLAHEVNPQAKMADNLAAAWAERGDFARAVAIQQALVDRAKASVNPAVLAEEQYWLERYGKGQARRDAYLVRDSDEEADVARRLVARLVPQAASAAQAQRVPPPKPKPVVLTPKNKQVPHTAAQYGVQVASYRNFAHARLAVEQLHARHHAAYAFKVILPDGQVWYRVVVGPYDSLAAAQASSQTLRSQNYDGAFEIPVRYGLALQDLAPANHLPKQIRTQLYQQGFFPYQGGDAQWLVGAYRRADQALARKQDLAAGGIAVKMIKF